MTKTILFNLVCCLVVCPTVFAQAQAPITWNEPQWAHIAGWPGTRMVSTMGVIPGGDTLLYTAFRVANPVSDTILVCSSFDNGQTMTPWHAISDGGNRVSAQFTGSAGRYYCFFSQGTVLPDAVWLRVSEDGGLTWAARQQYRENAYPFCGFATEDEVIAKFITADHYVIRSINGGQNWSAPVLIDTANFYLLPFVQSIAFTASHRFIIEEPGPSRHDSRLYVATGDSSGQNWTTFQLLPCEFYNQWGANRAVCVGDTSSEVAGVLGEFGDDGWSPERPLYFRSDDVGVGWENCVAMTEEPHVIPWISTYLPLILTCQGKLWIEGWEQTTSSGWDSLAIRFSANHGRNWYPQQIAADSMTETNKFTGQIRGNRIDIYWSQYIQALGPGDFRSVSATIVPDTMAPEIFEGLELPAVSATDTTMALRAMAQDEDSLLLMQVILWIEGSEDSVVINLDRQAENNYHGTWHTPRDTSVWLYYYRAEDMWENVSYFPSDGPINPFVVNVGAQSAADPFILQPSSFSLSVFPNPFNSSTTISFTLPKTGEVKMVISDMLGRITGTAGCAPTGIQSAGEHRVVFDGSALASGIYFVRLESAGMVKLQKIMLLK